MKKFLKILWLRMSVGNLKRKRKEAVLDISMNHSKEASRAAAIEDVNPSYFKKIDNKISSRERLITNLSKKTMKQV